LSFFVQYTFQGDNFYIKRPIYMIFWTFIYALGEGGVSRTKTRSSWLSLWVQFIYLFCCYCLYLGHIWIRTRPSVEYQYQVTVTLTFMAL